ncbi:hypothetical protein ABZZ80_13200 [Streptomyces sp. NPDC006356]
MKCAQWSRVTVGDECASQGSALRHRPESVVRELAEETGPRVAAWQDHHRGRR